LRHLSHDGCQGGEFRCPHPGAPGAIRRARKGSARPVRGVRERPARRFPKGRARRQDCEQALAGPRGSRRGRALGRRSDEGV